MMKQPRAHIANKVVRQVKLYLSPVRIARLEEQAAYRGLSVNQFVSEVVDAALADVRTKRREEPTYTSTAALAAEYPYL